MTMVTLAGALQPALREGYAVAGLVVLGWEDARAYAQAADIERMPVILQAGPSCRRNTPIPILAAMFRHLGEATDIPVVAHLDHAHSVDECREAIDAGFTSVMIDGSRLELDRNIELTARVATLAAKAGVSCEGEIGFVGYQGGDSSRGTDPSEAGRFARETGVDAVAVSVGNVHLQQSCSSRVDIDHLRRIEREVDAPLVLHGGSGIAPEMRRVLATETTVCKFNIGTEMRVQFGRELRRAAERNPECFDRIELLNQTEAPLRESARRIMRTICVPVRHASSQDTC